MPKGENVEEMPDERLNPCGVVRGNTAEFDSDEENDGGEATKRGGGDDIV